jgi:aspartyl protease family protein
VNGGNQALDFMYLLGCLLLVGSGLMVRRLPLGQSLKMLIAWLLIFAAAFLAFALRDDFGALGRRAVAELRGDTVVETKGGELRIRRSEDGHYWIDGKVNDRPVRFLVDSGATVTTLSRDVARAAGITAEAGPGVLVDTANGVAIFDRGTVSRLRIGPIERGELAVQISRGDDDLNVIGMNFLSTLSAWGVEDNTLRLKS